MSFRKIKDSDLVGRTVKSVDNSCVNVVKLTFSDDSKLELWAETAISLESGDIPGIFVDE